MFLSSNWAKTTVIASVFAVALTAGSAASNADGHVKSATPGLYIGFSSGVVFESDFDGTLFGGGAAGQTYDIDLDTGYSIGGAIGWRFAPVSTSISPRVEVEVSYSERDVGEVNFSGNGAGAEQNVAGDLGATTLMFNGYLDFNTGTKVRPYIGAGIGWAFVNYDFQYQTGAGPQIQVNEADESSFAYQLMAGIEYQATSKLSFNLEGRYQEIVDVEIDRFNATAGGVLTGSVEDDVSSFSIRAGLRYSLGSRHSSAPLK